MKLSARVILIAASVLCATAFGQTVAFFDGTFTNWQVPVVYSTPMFAGASSNQVTTGGNSGPFLSVTHDLPFEVFAFHHRPGNSHDPATQGVVASVDFSIDFLPIPPLGGQMHAFAPAIFQGGQLYVGDGTAFHVMCPQPPCGTPMWDSVMDPALIESDFTLVTPSGFITGVHPSFSLPFDVGFFTGNEWTGGDLTGGYDNWSFTLNLVDASSQTVGTGCGGAVPPALAISTPILGQSFSFSISGGPPASQGFLFLGPPAPMRIPVAPGCDVVIDLLNLEVFTPVTLDGLGLWSTSIGLPNAPSLAGISIAFQAVLIPTASPLGFDLTNGVDLILGY